MNISSIDTFVSVFKNEKDCETYIINLLFGKSPNYNYSNSLELAMYKKEKDNIKMGRIYGLTCPYCGSATSYIIENGKRFKCASSMCYRKYSTFTNTMYHSSKLSHLKYLFLLFLFSLDDKITTTDVARKMGVAQKTSWFNMIGIKGIKIDRRNKTINEIFDEYVIAAYSIKKTMRCGVTE